MIGNVLCLLCLLTLLEIYFARGYAILARQSTRFLQAPRVGLGLGIACYGGRQCEVVHLKQSCARVVWVIRDFWTTFSNL